MRSTGLLVFICFVFTALDCRAGDRPDASGSAWRAERPGAALHRIEVTQNIRFVRLNENLEQLCGSPDPLRGCTKFAQESLETGCTLEPDGWRLGIVARFDLSVLVDEPRTLLHERQHLIHLQRLLDEYLEKMTQPVFPSRSRCQTLANILSRETYVRAMMNELRRASNDLFQCSRPGGEAGPELLVHLEEHGPGRAAAAR